MKGVNNYIAPNTIVKTHHNYPTDDALTSSLQVLIDGQDVAELPLDRLRMAIEVIPQNPVVRILVGLRDLVACTFASIVLYLIQIKSLSFIIVTI